MLWLPVPTSCWPSLRPTTSSTSSRLEAQILPQYPGAIVSQSFGDDETDPTAQDAFQQLHDIFSGGDEPGRHDPRLGGRLRRG